MYVSACHPGPPKNSCFLPNSVRADCVVWLDTSNLRVAIVTNLTPDNFYLCLPMIQTTELRVQQSIAEATRAVLVTYDKYGNDNDHERTVNFPPLPYLWR